MERLRATRKKRHAIRETATAKPPAGFEPAQACVEGRRLRPSATGADFRRRPAAVASPEVRDGRGIETSGSATAARAPPGIRGARTVSDGIGPQAGLEPAFSLTRPKRGGVLSPRPPGPVMGAAGLEPAKPEGCRVTAGPVFLFRTHPMEAAGLAPASARLGNGGLSPRPHFRWGRRELNPHSEVRSLVSFRWTTSP